MNANLIFKRLKDSRFKPDVTEESVILPVEVPSTDMALAPALADDHLVQNQNPGSRIEIVLDYKLALFMFWSSLDRVANSMGVSPSRLECGLVLL